MEYAHYLGHVYPKYFSWTGTEADSVNLKNYASGNQAFMQNYIFHPAIYLQENITKGTCKLYVFLINSITRYLLFGVGLRLIGLFAWSHRSAPQPILTDLEATFVSFWMVARVSFWK